MTVELRSIEKPFRNLRRLLKKIAEPPEPEQVHQLRTGARRIEAMLHALELGHRSVAGELIAHLKPIRKAAGAVRDMDVLIASAATLPHEGEEECFVHLLEELAEERRKAANKLDKTLNARQRATRELLKKALDSLVSGARGNGKESVRTNPQMATQFMASSLQLETELAEWPKLNVRNLHAYRLKVKELRSLLELGRKPDKNFRNALRAVKDHIGAWHDWSELSRIAAIKLRHGASCALQQRISAREKEQRRKALASANRVQENYFGKSSAGRLKKDVSSVRLGNAAVSATADLAG
jgi:CHAD domain-containing protein